jgi:hypothetical protein
MRLFYPHARRDHYWRDRHHGFGPLHLYADIHTLRFPAHFVKSKWHRSVNRSDNRYSIQRFTQRFKNID